MTTPVYIKPFVEAVEEAGPRLARRAENGDKILGYFCTYTPVELLYACGFLPVRVLGGAGRVEKAYALTPEFICPYMRLSLERALAGEYDFLSGLVQGYTCDAACGLVNIWAENIKGDVFTSVPLPYNDTPESRKFLRSSLEAVMDKLLKTIGGSFSEDELEEALDLYGENRQMVLDLHQSRYDGASVLSAGDFHHVVQAGFVTPPRDYRAMLLELRRAVDHAPPARIAGAPILISGSLIEAPGVFETIESCGGRIVADDLCTGVRGLTPADGVGTDPWDRLMDRYFKRSPCPSRTRAGPRADLLAELARRARARGVVFALQKYCTPHLADHPLVSEKLRKLGIPSILIEMDETWKTEGQVRTRLEAFFEMLAQ
ncbi:MAG: 2-hydroxyacyl-CoA dehydratase [Desulfobacterales bacterium]|nr:2-hydroxyacyl-CoA dehydratase [Desulfobacterales bacterium]